MLDVRSFGVASPSEFFHKYVAQGCWTRCLRCQRDAGIAMATSDITPGTTSHSMRSCGENEGEVCRICAEKFPNLESHTDEHRCSACRLEYKNELWPSNILEDHKRRSGRLICSSCKEEGCTPHDVSKYACSDCKQRLGHARFNNVDLDHAKRRGRISTLRCLDCKSLIKCSACQTGYQKFYLGQKRAQQFATTRQRFGLQRLSWERLHCGRHPIVSMHQLRQRAWIQSIRQVSFGEFQIQGALYANLQGMLDCQSGKGESFTCTAAKEQASLQMLLPLSQGCMPIVTLRLWRKVLARKRWAHHCGRQSFLG